MQGSVFKIYNASAGSGKTFTIAKSYIKILVASQSYDKFKSILAITFTNKAVGEMKARVIDMLKHFSSEESLAQPHAMFSAICKELSISPEYLQNKSKLILKYIIHNYGAFDISTIDGFTHRVIRTFAHDLKLPQNFEVELDQDRLLNEAVDRLISKAGDDEMITNILLDFAYEKTDDDKSWDLSYDFNKIAKLLINENDLSKVRGLRGKSLEDFSRLKKGLSEQKSVLENDIVKIAKETLTLIDECGLQFDDFNRKSLPNHFKNLSQKKFNISFDTSWQNDLVEGRALYPKRVTDIISSTIENIQPNIAEAFLKSKTLVFELKLRKGLFKNITPLSVLNAIQNELDSIKEERNVMLISEFNKIISDEIKDQPTPFIYERLGEKFKHYFIDEFQDTSNMQWENLVPLLDNALSGSNGSAMLVGDAKQAIYRWRGGEAKQFISLYNKTKNPFQIEATVLSLSSNYRSAKEIVNFNNQFFKFLSEEYFTNTLYAELYEHSTQESNSTLEGYVNIDFLDISKEDDYEIMYANRVYETIKNCRENGYTLDDICVIVRKRKEGIYIANYLSEKGIKITSSETLLLKNSDKVQFIDSFLKLLLQPDNDSLKIKILIFLIDQNSILDKHHFFETHLKPDLKELFLSLRALDIFLDKDALLRLPLYELVEELIRIFNLNNTSDAYLQFYLDEVLEFTQKQNSDLAAFIDYFEKKKDNLTVISPQNVNAVKIMTIHKSKGLEFPVVIFPFAELDIYRELDPKLWFPIDKSIDNNFETLLLNYNKDIRHFGEIGEYLFKERQSQLELDNINLLYVTLTRAEEQLFIISKKDINSKGIVNPKTYGGMLISYLQSIGLWSSEQETYSFGSSKPNQLRPLDHVKSDFLQLISVPKEDHDLSIITRSGQLWDTKQEKAIEHGNLVHLILSKIKTSNDLDFVFNNLISSGEIIKEDEIELRDSVLRVINHPKLKQYYTGNFDTYNERDIITQKGRLLRPDRININTKNEAIIIDYKTGEQKTTYKSQLHEYATTLEAMNYLVKHKYIVYVNDMIDIIEV